MKRAGGFDQCYNGHTAVDAHVQIIVAAEPSNNASDSDRLPVLLAAVKKLWDRRAEKVFAELASHPTEIIVALGREEGIALKIDTKKNPHPVAMTNKLATERVRAAYRRRKAIVEPPNGWIKHIVGF
ncbi:hypothetical protein [Herminiimonas sp. CN]|uniref:hypothetical protein n=1 Tax=Herminiimonas sp. CN TaxID=1349818 RepID=UPI000473B848|nr:hypothetical protein [Herminiimonas sp. CN]